MTVEGWSIPEQVHGSFGTISEPALAADQTGTLHAFWYEVDSEADTAIFYARWQDGKWTQPVDVIAWGGVEGPSAAVDIFGQVHLIWFGPGNNLFYSRAPAASATSATNWSVPVSVASSNPHAQIVADSAGTLHIVYAALQDGGVKYISSADGGDTWTEPISVAERVRADATANFARLALAQNGALHVVWTELTLPEGWPPLGVYYAHSTDGGRSWSEPLQVAGDGYLEGNVTAADESTVYVAWNGRASISGRYHQWSGDGGNTWSPVTTLTLPELGGGSTNPPALATDSEGVVHAILNTSPGGSDATMHVYGRDGDWSTPVDVSQAAPGYIGLINEASALAITGGNQLHVLFVDNDGARIWHTEKTSSAPAVPAMGFLAAPWLPAATLTPTLEAVTQTSANGPIATSSAVAPTSLVNQAQPLRGLATRPAMSVLMSVLPPALVVTVVALFTLLRRRAR